MEDDPFQDLVRRILDLTEGFSHGYVRTICGKRWIEAGIEKDDVGWWAANVYHVTEGCGSALRFLPDNFRKTDPQDSVDGICSWAAFTSDIPVFIIHNATEYALPLMEKYFASDPEDDDVVMNRLSIASREADRKAASEDDPLQDFADRIKDLISEMHLKYVRGTCVPRWIEAGVPEQEAEEWAAAIFRVLHACEIILLNLVDHCRETDPHRSALDIYHWMAFVDDIPVFMIEHSTEYIVPFMEKYETPYVWDEDDE